MDKGVGKLGDIVVSDTGIRAVSQTDIDNFLALRDDLQQAHQVRQGVTHHTRSGRISKVALHQFLVFIHGLQSRRRDVVAVNNQLEDIARHALQNRLQCLSVCQIEFA